MMMRRTAAICPLLALLATPIAAQSRPVMIGGEADIDACNSFWRVRGLNPRGDGFLSVRAAPGTDKRELDRLFNGDGVFVCEQAGDWFGIVYPGAGLKPGSEIDCKVGSPVPRQRAYAGPCRSGWVHKRFLEVIAG
jgi:hypothetical protein